MVEFIGPELIGARVGWSPSWLEPELVGARKSPSWLEPELVGA